MAVRIRLTRTGARNAACFRVVAADSRSPRDGRFLEILGWYDPKQKAGDFKIDAERVAHWVNQGAEISETVSSLIKRAKAVTDDSAEAAAEAAAVAAAAPAPVSEPVAEPVVEDTDTSVAQDEAEEKAVETAEA